MKGISQQCLCDQPGAVVIGAPNVTTTLAQAITQGLLPMPQASNIPQNVCIRGTLSVNQDYSFTTSFISMDEGASISVSGSLVDLSIHNSTVSGCGAMWHRISVSANSGLSITSSTVRDGQQAVFAMSKSNVTLNGNNFVNNNVGLFISSPTPGGGLSSTGGIVGNTFETQGGLLPPLAGQLGFAGIQAQNINGFTVGSTNQSAPANNFKTLRNGIVANRCAFAVHGASFYDILPGGVTSPFIGTGLPSAYGLFTENRSSLLVSDCVFELLNTGIHCTNSSIEAYDNNFKATPDAGFGVTTGIRVFMSTDNPSIKIHDNAFNVISFGIKLIEVGMADPLVVENNVIDVGEHSDNYLILVNIGIEVADSHFPPSKRGRVLNNTIATHPSFLGISSLNTSYLDIWDNNITLNPVVGTAIQIGVSLSESDHLDVRGNSVIFSQVQSDAYYGINSFRTTNSFFCCNVVNGQIAGGGDAVGIRFDDVCTGTKLRGTIIGNARTGLQYRPSAITGWQINANNLWTGSYAAFGAQHLGDETTVNMSLYKVGPFAPPTLPSSIDAPGQWFGPGLSQPPYECPSESSCGLLLEESLVDSAGFIIAAGTWETGLYYQGTLNWSAERQLYGMLSNNLGLLQQYPQLQAFYSTKQGTPVQRFHDLGAKIATLAEAGGAAVALKTANLGLIYGELHELTAIDRDLWGATGGQKETLLVEREAALGELDALMAAHDSLGTVTASQRLTEISLVDSINATIAVSQVFEENLKLVNNVWLDTWAKGIPSFDSAQLAVLGAVAYQCPLTGGSAVTVARNMLSTAVVAVFDDEESCNGTAQRSAPGVPARPAPFGLQLYPNPATGNVTVVAKEGTFLPALMELTAQSGKVVRRVVVPANSASYVIGLDGLPNGLYFLRAKGQYTAAPLKLTILR